MIKKTAKQIEDRFSEMGFNIPNSEIESRLDKLLNEFRVPAEEARRSVVNYFLKEYNIPRGDYYTQQGEASAVNVKEIDIDGKWVDIRVKVTQLWENNHESIGQVGLAGDETGTIKFTKWANAGLPELEEGKSYLLKNAVSSTFQGRFQINLNRTSQIEEIDTDIQVSTNEVESLGAISDINADDNWINIRAKVVQLWDNNHESIGQVGLLGDETGTIKFTKWASAELPDIEEGKSYLFKSVVTSSFQERFQVNLNRASQIEAIEEDIEIGIASVEFAGAMVDIQSGSGLIKRCPQCNRALIKGVCGEHSKVEGTYDLRIKAVMDDGVSVQDALLNREISERLTGISLDDAVRMATEALEQSVVIEKIKQDLVGKYYTLSGPRLDRYILVENISPLPLIDNSQIDALIAKSDQNIHSGV